MNTTILLVGGDRRQTALAARCEARGEVFTLAVPDRPDRLPRGAADLLILPCPCFDGAGRIRAGASGLPRTALSPWLGEKTRVFGGALRGWTAPRGETVDLLEDPAVVTENARLTAEAAVCVALTHTGRSLRGRRCAVLGCGRIGSALAPLLRAFGAAVTVVERKPEKVPPDYPRTGFDALPPGLELLFNTVPARALSGAAPDPDALWIELASVPGLPTPAPCKVLPAPGLPGRVLPESAARALYDAILRREVKE